MSLRPRDRNPLVCPVAGAWSVNSEDRSTSGVTTQVTDRCETSWRKRLGCEIVTSNAEDKGPGFDGCYLELITGPNNAISGPIPAE